MPRKKREKVAQYQTVITMATPAVRELIRRLVENGIGPDDLAHLLGHCDRARLKRVIDKDDELKVMVEEARNVANTSLCESAMKAACGYSFENTQTKFVAHYDDNGKLEWRESEKTVKREHMKPDSTLLRFLLVCKLPDVFAEGRLLEKKRDSLMFGEGGAPSADAIEQLAGRLFDLAKSYRERVKPVDAKVLSSGDTDSDKSSAADAGSGADSNCDNVG